MNECRPMPVDPLFDPESRAQNPDMYEPVCVTCGSKLVRHEDFTDLPSRKEYHLSGMCQKYQDVVFTEGEDEPVISPPQPPDDDFEDREREKERQERGYEDHLLSEAQNYR